MFFVLVVAVGIGFEAQKIFEEFKKSNEPPAAWTEKAGHHFQGHEKLFALIKRMVDPNPLKRPTLREVRVEIEKIRAEEPEEPEEELAEAYFVALFNE